MRWKLIAWLILACFTAFCASSLFAEAETFKPKDGFIPDEKTAIRVAEAVLSPIYGEDKIISERPFTAKLNKDVWTVTGHLREGLLGGVAEIRISKTTGKIISVTHGR